MCPAIAFPLVPGADGTAALIAVDLSEIRITRRCNDLGICNPSHGCPDLLCLTKCFAPSTMHLRGQHVNALCRHGHTIRWIRVSGGRR
jgi:hypothetical protein